MSERAAPDYEPTVEEIQEFVHSFDDCQPGQHGQLIVVPTMERYIWSIPVFWGHREVQKDGFVSLSWFMPPFCEHCDNL